MQFLKNNSLKYDFWIILITIVWGSTFFVVKNTVAVMDAYLLVFYRNFIAGFIMLAWMLIKDRKALQSKSAMKDGAILGFFLAAMYFAQTIGLKYTSSGHSAFIISSAVIIVPLLLRIFYKIKIQKIVISAISIVLVGLFVMTYDPTTVINIGDYITIFSAIAYAIYIILSGKYVRKNHMLSLITYQFIFSSFFSLVAFLINGGNITPLTNELIVSLLHLGLGGTLFCYFITVWVQKYVSSTKMTILFTLEPVFAALFAYIAVNEKFSNTDFIGSLLILIGVFFYQARDLIIKNRKVISNHEANNS